MARIMNLAARILVLYLVTGVSAYSQGRGNIAAGRGPVEIDYEAIRLTKIVTAVRIDGDITLDGRLEEPEWQLAIPATDFSQRTPRTGEPASERTEARFIYDDDNIYIGLTCFDSDLPHMMVTELKEDFDISRTDLIQLIFDSLHDGRSGFSFSVNPAGGRRDSQLSQNGTVNNDWDGVWDAKTSQNDKGWFIEYRIPFKTLRFTNSQSQVWGVQVSRRLLRNNEESNWAPVPQRFGATRTALAGTLLGLEGIRQGRNLKVKPYIIARTTQIRTGTGLQTTQSLGDFGRKYWQCATCPYQSGFDVKYSLTSSITLDGTYHTDFAQVEADQQQVNLTRFNLFFPEKRDFFLENVGIFTFGAGGNNQANSNMVPFFSRRIGLSSSGTPIPIVAGSRVSGQVSGFDFGVVAMKTERLLTTPSNNYLVGRLRRNLFRNSWIGGVVTNRDSTLHGDHNRVYGTDAHFQFYDRLEFDSYVLKSATSRFARGLGKDQTRRFQTAWRDDELNISAEYNDVQTNFNPEVGFVRRGNMSQYAGDVSWRPRLDNSDVIRNLIFSTSVDYYNSGTSGKVESRLQEATFGVQFENNGSANFTVNQTFDRLVTPFPIRSNLSIPRGDYKYRSYIASINTGQSRKLAGNGTVTWGEFWNGHTKAVSGILIWRPHYHFNVDLNYSRNNVELPNGNFTTNLVGVRFLYAFTPRAFFNAFLQYNADTRQVSSNIRFNVIHHPLSDLYLVYNDRRDTTNGQLVERAFIIKLTNLLNF